MTSGQSVNLENTIRVSATTSGLVAVGNTTGMKKQTTMKEALKVKAVHGILVGVIVHI